MPTLQQIRQGLVANLSAIPGCQTSAYALSSPTLPALYVLPGGVGGATSIQYDQAMGRGMDTWRMRVVAMTGAVDDQGSQMLMDEFLAPAGAKSVKAAVEADRTLGGVVDDLRVEAAGGYAMTLREGQGPALTVEFQVTVFADGRT